MSDKNKGFLFDLIDDFVVLKNQDSPDNLSANRDSEKIDANNVTKDGDLHEGDIDAHSVTNDGDINEYEASSDNVVISKNTFNIENININPESCKDIDETSPETNIEIEPIESPNSDLDFEFGG